MMADTSRITHSRGGNNHLRRHVKVDVFGILAGNGKLKARKADGVNPFLHKLHGFLVKAFHDIF